MTNVEIALEAPVLSVGAWKVEQSSPGGDFVGIPDASPPFGVLGRIWLPKTPLAVEVGYRQSVGWWRFDELSLRGTSGYGQLGLALHTAEGEAEAYPYVVFSGGLGAGYAALTTFDTRSSVRARAALEIGFGYRGGWRPRIGVRADTGLTLAYWDQWLNLTAGHVSWTWDESNAGVRVVVGLTLPRRK